MMSKECAATILQRRASWLQRKIPEFETRAQSMGHHYRAELGAIRCLMHLAGWPKERLPEVPYLDPVHLENWKQRKEDQAAFGELSA